MNPFELALSALEDQEFQQAPPGFTARQAVLLSLQALVIVLDAIYLWLLHHTQLRNSGRGMKSAGPGVWWVARWVDRPMGPILVVNQRVMSTIFSALAQVVWISYSVDNLLTFTGKRHSLGQSIVWRAITALSLLGWFWVLTWGNITSFIIAADPKIDSRIVNAVLLGLGVAQLAAGATTSGILIARGKRYNDVLESFQSNLRSKAATYPDVPVNALADTFTQASVVQSAGRTYYFMFYVLSVLAAAMVAIAVVLNFGGLLLERTIKRQIVFNKKICTSPVATQQNSVPAHQGSTNCDSTQGGPGFVGGGTARSAADTQILQPEPRNSELITLAGLRRARRDVLTMFGLVLCFALIAMAPLMFILVEARTVDVTQLSWVKKEVILSGSPWAVTSVMLAAQIALIWIAIAFHRQGRRDIVHLNVDGSSVTAPVDAMMLERGTKDSFGSLRATSMGSGRTMRKDQRSQVGSDLSQGSKIFVDVDVEVDRSGNSEEDMGDIAELEKYRPKAAY